MALPSSFSLPEEQERERSASVEMQCNYEVWKVIESVIGSLYANTLA